MTRTQRTLGSILTTTLLGAAMLAGFAEFGGLHAQDAGKAKGGKRAERQLEREQERAAKEKAHAERLATFVKGFPAAKVTLAAAVESAEKATKGHAYDVAFHLEKDGTLALTVGVVVAEKFFTVDVDPTTGTAKPAVAEAEPDPDLGDDEADD